MSMRNKSSV